MNRTNVKNRKEHITCKEHDKRKEQNERIKFKEQKLTKQTFRENIKKISNYNGIALLLDDWHESKLLSLIS
jgi:hypothetical protein